MSPPPRLCAYLFSAQSAPDVGGVDSLVGSTSYHVIIACWRLESVSLRVLRFLFRKHREHLVSMTPSRFAFMLRQEGEVAEGGGESLWRNWTRWSSWEQGWPAVSRIASYLLCSHRIVHTGYSICWGNCNFCAAGQEVGVGHTEFAA